jgi:16S rRNA (cytosine967-C5)-methyltransferase
MKHFSHLNTAIGVIQQYDGKEPLHYFLKKLFSRDKKFGSADRRRISQLCYVFLRVGKMVLTGFSHDKLTPAMIEETILIGLFLCSEQPDVLLGSVKPDWNERISLPVSEKFNFLNQSNHINFFQPENLFPWFDELSEGIEKIPFTFSHLLQPDLFLRVRPGHKDTVVQKLQQHDAEYELIPPVTIRLQNGFKVNEVFAIDKEIVIQDLSSQEVGKILQPVKSVFPKPVSVWDCCAASGGKSIMMKDLLSDIELTVSDVRESILANLKKRFANAGLTNYKSFIADLSTADTSGQLKTLLPEKNYDIILADLPCTGSGTWSRTPEQLYFFQQSSIEKYNQLQKQIISNIVPYLKKPGKLLYATCSVFKKENEEIVRYLIERFHLKLERMELLKGYHKKADTMFAALLNQS